MLPCVGTIWIVTGMTPLSRFWRRSRRACRSRLYAVIRSVQRELIIKGLKTDNRTAARVRQCGNSLEARAMGNAEPDGAPVSVALSVGCGGAARRRIARCV